MATEQTQKMVTVTAKAAEKIHEFMKEEAESPEYLRVYVHGTRKSQRTGLRIHSTTNLSFDIVVFFVVFFHEFFCEVFVFTEIIIASTT